MTWIVAAVLAVSLGILLAGSIAGLVVLIRWARRNGWKLPGYNMFTGRWSDDPTSRNDGSRTSDREVAMSDIDNDNFEGTTRHEQRWVVRGGDPVEVCQRVAACLSTSSAGSSVKVRKGSRVIYGLLGASLTPRGLLPVKLWISAASSDEGHVAVSVIAKSGAAERGIDGLARGPKRFQAAFDLWLTKIRGSAPPEEST